MGDGFMASFGSVTKAVECAIALQRAFAEREGEPLSVRVGLNAGEPIAEDGDLFGATVILASRIAAKAGPGEILVLDVRGAGVPVHPIHPRPSARAAWARGRPKRSGPTGSISNQVTPGSFRNQVHCLLA